MKSRKDILFRIFKNMYGEYTGHDYYHVLRVLENARKIYLKENKNTKMNWEVIELACLLHDVADHKFFKGTEEESEAVLVKIMKNADVEVEIIKQVMFIVSHMSFKGGKNEKVQLSNEGKVVRDADRLDALGAVGVARAFATGSFFKRPIYNPENMITKKFKNIEEVKNAYGVYEQNTLNHFYEKLLLLKDLMLTKTGKQLAQKRHKYMLDFLNQFKQEVGTQ